MQAKIPKTLYEHCLCTFVNKLDYKVSTLDRVQTLRYLPAGMLIDIYIMMSKREELRDMLLEQLADLQTFERLLKFDPARQKLFSCINALTNSKKVLASYLQQDFTMRYGQKLGEDQQDVRKYNKNARKQKRTKDSNKKFANKDQNITSADETESVVYNMRIDGNLIKDYTNSKNISDSEISENETNHLEPELFNIHAIDFGMRLGAFLLEAGWVWESIHILLCVSRRLKKLCVKKPEVSVVRLDCLQRLLHSQTALCSFKSAERTSEEITTLIKGMTSSADSLPSTSRIPNSLLANTYSQLSAMHFGRSEYNESYKWSVAALRNLDENTPEKISIDVLRQAAKACVVKRDFQRANMLICQASRRARTTFGEDHQKYADTLMDYGFFLLNVDCAHLSVGVYKDALDVKRYVFGEKNFHVAIAHEDLSYAYYVHEYSTGNFLSARDHVEKAIEIMKEFVPSDHIKLASAKRVKALLLEEIALDKMTDGVDEEDLLKQSEELHNFALHLSLEVFGEINVQTAKHYGNLGRLYQTMKRFDEAERMHQKAIKIKTDLLGPFDYEVGLSVGHLASLYNYQMKKYREAELLYLRSIEISLRLFGQTYSGLEYDYLGLCQVYETLHEFEKYLKYATILENWQMLRAQLNPLNKPYYAAIDESYSVEEIKYQFFSMPTVKLDAPV